MRNNDWQDAARATMGASGGLGSTEGGDLSGALGGLGGLLGGLFGSDGSQYSSQIPDIYKQYLGPYAQMGSGLIPGLESQYQGMLDPSQLGS